MRVPVLPITLLVSVGLISIFYLIDLKNTNNNNGNDNTITESRYKKLSQTQSVLSTGNLSLPAENKKKTVKTASPFSFLPTGKKPCYDHLFVNKTGSFDLTCSDPQNSTILTGPSSSFLERYVNFFSSSGEG